ncbi:efflux RND transporter periplasmic adaptor subunit [Halovulum dunhuangense]|uniref:Efflux RND transporter periplasmic adaptor subunit n=1 Tax=Halovulum dunhuangense TaxID=1505036 RepID=A0A849L5D6_9RHOB|nr:efflux RND transporter periplasmic adaptor subunit [Halovulum dunhuangense]NNU81473.1 efflux RND transporter periplasmic adaptor subunit [Halovulum dunhuangense]
MRSLLSALLVTAIASPLAAQTLEVVPQDITEWKAVHGQVETRDRVPARVRIGGSIVELTVTEGDRVEAGQQIALVRDDKLEFQLAAIDAQREALAAQMQTATADLERGRELLERGVISNQRLEQLQSAVDVIAGEMRALQSQRLGVEQQVTEGAVISPEAGVVLDVPVARGSFVTPGEAVAVIGGGGVFLRLAVPERHAASLSEGDVIELGSGGQRGTLARLYPQIFEGRVEADVEVEGLDARYVGRRLPVRLPVATRSAILVPQAALSRAGGLDFVTVEAAGGEVRRTVVPGAEILRDGEPWREILTGLVPGDMVVLSDE